MKKNVFWEYMRVSVITIIIMIIVLIIVSFVGQRTIVNGNSMYPQLKDGDNIWVDKLAYSSDNVERYDVVIFPHFNEKLNKEIYYIKRVIGMPGEIIQINDGVIYIDGEELKEYYGYYESDLAYYNGIAEEEIYIGEDEYFVLGDNRNDSEDSRAFGCISKDEITGKAAIKIFPFTEIEKIK